MSVVLVFYMDLESEINFKHKCIISFISKNQPHATITTKTIFAKMPIKKHSIKC